MAVQTPPFIDPDLAARQRTLERRRGIYDALTARSLQPVQPASGGYYNVPVSPFQGLSQIAQSYFAQRGQKKADTEEAAISTEYQQRRLKAIQDALREDVPWEQQMTSMYPEVREVGKMRAEQAMKNLLTPKDLLGVQGADLPSRIEGATGGGVTALRPEPKTTSVGGHIVESTPGQPPKSTGYFGDSYETNPDGSTKIYQIPGADGKPEPYIREKNSGGYKKLDTAPKVTQNVHPTTRFGTKVPESLAKAASDRYAELGKSLSANQQKVRIISEMEALDKQGILSNATADFRAKILNLAQLAGIPVNEQLLGNTETYRGEASKVWLQMMESVTGGARGLTEAETLELKKAIPQAAHSPAARQTIYRLARKASDEARARFQKASTALAAAMEADDPAMLTKALEGMFDEGPAPTSPTDLGRFRINPPGHASDPYDRYKVK